MADPDPSLGRRFDENGEFLSTTGVALAALAAILLCWPMLLVTAPLGYFDTEGYLSGGRAIATWLADGIRAAAPAEQGAAPTAGPGPADGVRVVRSFPYSVFVYLTSLTPLHLVLTTIVQTFATLVLVLPLLPRVSRAHAGRAVLGLLLVGGVTTLPWFASYAMPDILAAAVLLYFMLLADPMDDLGLGWQATFAAIASFAVASHYGHIPLAAGLLVVVVVLRWLRGKSLLRPVLLGALPVVLTLALNLAGSSAALGGTSVAPKRLPILLGRSIADGPGALYLEAACPEAGYAICQALPEVPTNLTTFLWSQDGIGGLTVQELDRVRDEEARLLWHIFLAHPLEQTRALVRNGAYQAILVGTGEVQPLEPLGAPGGTAPATSREMTEAHPVVAAFDVVTKVGTGIGTALLLLLLARGRPPRDWNLAIVCGLGLLSNALIFGGLSAPVDRYQSRVVWIIPVLALIFWLRDLRQSSSAPTGQATIGSGLAAHAKVRRGFGKRAALPLLKGDAAGASGGVAGP